MKAIRWGTTAQEVKWGKAQWKYRTWGMSVWWKDALEVMTAGGRVDRRDAGDRRADGVMDGEGRTLRFIYGSCQTYSISRYERCYRSCDFSTYALVNDGESGENCCTVYWWHSKISVPVPWLFIIILNTQIIWIQKHDTLLIKSFGSVKLLLKVEHFSASRNKKLLSCFSKNI